MSLFLETENGSLFIRMKWTSTAMKVSTSYVTNASSLEFTVYICLFYGLLLEIVDQLDRISFDSTVNNNTISCVTLTFCNVFADALYTF